jgi:regulator of chromosome condensation
MATKEMNDNNKEGLYVYGSGEMDQLSPIKEEEKYSEIYDTKIPLKIPLHFISEKEKISKIKCGQMFTMILSTKGNVYTFGCADNGGIGHEDSIPAKKVDLNFKALDISGGDCHGIAYNNTNLAFWGQIRNSQGCIGEPFLNIKYYNISDINNEKIKKAISGTNHVIILTEEKNIFAFGNKEYGQRGINPKEEIDHMRINKINEDNIDDIFTGDEHSFLTKIENNKKIVKSWGLNSKGQLGIGKSSLDGEEYISIYKPTEILFDENIVIKKICGGNSNSLCITEDNRIFIWGANDDNLLGLNNDEPIINKPKEIIFFNKYTNPENEVNEITSAYQSFYARNTVNNKVYSWGNGDSFILGNKKEKSEKNPYLIDFNFFKNMKVSQLEMGCSHVAVLLTKEERVYINNKKEEKKKEEEKVIKPKKRKSADENEDNLEKNKDNDKLEKVKANYIREEFITLNVRDKPKIFKILNYK